MTDTHDLLRFLRSSIASDPRGFHAVAFLRRAVHATEAELVEALDIGAPSCKSLLMRLHQAGLVEVGADGSYRLTEKAAYLADVLDITSSATRSVVSGLPLGGSDRDILKRELEWRSDGLQERPGVTLARFQALALTLHWSSHKLAESTQRRVAHAFLIGLNDEFARVGVETYRRTLASWSHRSEREPVGAVRRLDEVSGRRLRSASRDAALCDDFLFHGGLPGTREARAVVLLVTMSRFTEAVVFGQADKSVVWALRQSPDTGRDRCSELVAWDRDLVVQVLNFSSRRPNLESRDQPGRRADDGLAQRLYSLVSSTITSLSTSRALRSGIDGGAGSRAFRSRMAPNAGRSFDAEDDR